MICQVPLRFLNMNRFHCCTFEKITCTLGRNCLQIGNISLFWGLSSYTSCSVLFKQEIICRITVLFPNMLWIIRSSSTESFGQTTRIYTEWSTRGCIVFYIQGSYCLVSDVTQLYFSAHFCTDHSKPVEVLENMKISCRILFENEQKLHKWAFITFVWLWEAQQWFIVWPQLQKV